jgi:hypothetical protein
MQQSNRHHWAKPSPNRLSFSQEQVTFILGHSLRSLYDVVVTADMPDRLKALVQALANKQTPASGA